MGGPIVKFCTVELFFEKSTTNKLCKFSCKNHVKGRLFFFVLNYRVHLSTISLSYSQSPDPLERNPSLRPIKGLSPLAVITGKRLYRKGLQLINAFIYYSNLGQEGLRCQRCCSFVLYIACGLINLYKFKAFQRFAGSVQPHFAPNIATKSTK